MLRTILAVLAFALFLIFMIPVNFIEWLIDRRHPRSGDLRALHQAQWILRLLCRISGVKLTVLGRENLPSDHPVLYVSNHRSFFDVIITYTLCPTVTGYIAKKELKRIPLLSRWAVRLHCLFIDRDDIKQGLKTILTAIDYVKSGISIAVFPEGTRGRCEDETQLQPFREGSFKIATKSGCPVIPVAVSHSSQILEDHFPFIRPAQVTVEYGTPIQTASLSREEQKLLGKRVEEAIHAMLVKNH